jgi:predicted PurR-regulated permease PerM
MNAGDDGRATDIPAQALVPAARSRPPVPADDTEVTNEAFDETFVEHAADDTDVAAMVHAAEVEAAGLGGGGAVLGTPGPQLNRHTPFMVGLMGAAGVAVMYALCKALVSAASILALIGLALFLAIGLEPVVAWLTRRKVHRGVAVAVVALLVVGVVGGFLAAAIPPLATQVEAFISHLPTYVAQMKDHSTTLGKLDLRFHIQQHIDDFVNGSSITTGILSAGQLVLTTTASTTSVMVLTIYLLFDLPRIRRLAYRMMPASRRPRVILIGDEVLAKVGRYVLGNMFTSLIAGVGTFIWLFAFGVPYPVVLAAMVAIFDLIPVVGSTIAGVIVSLIAVSVSVPVAIATAIFYVAYRLLEDYLIVPRVIGRAVHVSGTVTIVAVLIGAAVLGLLGALVAIPAAAAIDVMLRETVFPRLDRT